MHSPSHISAAQGGFAITTSDTVDFATRARAIYVGGGGNITLVGADGVAFLLTAVPQGSIIDCECTRVNLTGTTATLLVGFK